MTIDTDPVSMSLSTRCTLDLESVVVWVCICIGRPKVSDTSKVSSSMAAIARPDNTHSIRR